VTRAPIQYLDNIMSIDAVCTQRKPEQVRFPASTNHSLLHTARAAVYRATVSQQNSRPHLFPEELHQAQLVQRLHTSKHSQALTG